MDPNIHPTHIKLPDFPSHLKQADRLQVLVTGSLHLIGGVIGLLDPYFNEGKSCER
jgi:hypothetical protein